MSTQLTDGHVARRESADVDCTVSVSRNAAGDLADGVRERLESADGVDGVESLDLSGIQPGLNDLTVTVSARVRADDAAALRDELENTFGVTEVELEARKGPP